MLYPYIIHIILIGVRGIYCEIKTVTTVYVEAGGSISIPCLYERKYQENLKYLCKGYFWISCKEVVKTTSPKMKTKRFSIADDTEQRIFTVDIRELTNKDEYFWCAVEIKNKQDDGQRFHLSVTAGVLGLYYVSKQETKVFERGTVTVTCHYKYPTVNEWCRLGSTCVRDEIGIMDGSSVKINKSVPGVFNVTMNDLKTQNSGCYWCSSEQFQMPVYIKVYEFDSVKTISANATTLSTTSFIGSNKSHTTILPNSTEKETRGVILKDEHKSFTRVIILISTLTIQLLVVFAALFGWKVIKQKKAKEVNVNALEQVSDMFYATIAHKQDTPVQTKELCAERDLDVTYSSVVIATQPNIKRSEEYEEPKTYSTVAHKEQKPKLYISYSISVIYTLLFINILVCFFIIFCVTCF